MAPVLGIFIPLAERSSICCAKAATLHTALSLSRKHALSDIDLHRLGRRMNMMLLVSSFLLCALSRVLVFAFHDAHAAQLAALHLRLPIALLFNRRRSLRVHADIIV
jgi:hypothetical protein